MSNIEDLMILAHEEVIPTFYTSGKKNLYAFAGLADFGNTNGVSKGVSSTLKTLKISKNLNSIQYKMYKKMLINTERVLTDDVQRTLYDTEVHERYIIAPLPATPKKFGKMQEEELILEKEFIRTNLSKVRSKIAALGEERALLRESKIPENRKNYVIEDRDWKALSYEVPRTQINVPLLRLKIAAENKEHVMIKKAILHDHKEELFTLREKALRICTLIHILDREIADQEIL